METSIDIAAPPEEVWDVLTDFAAYPDWNPFMLQASGEATVGSRLAVAMLPEGRSKPTTMKPTVTVADEPAVFEWLGKLVIGGIFDGRHRFELTPIENGATRFTQSEQFTGILTGLMLRWIGAGTEAGFQAMNAALKSRVESRHSTGLD